MRSGVRHLTPQHAAMVRVLARVRDEWLGWWDDPERCARLIVASGFSPKTGAPRRLAALLVLALLLGCGSASVTDPCYPPAIDTVVTRGHGDDLDTLVVSVQLCLVPPPIGRGW